MSLLTELDLTSIVARHFPPAEYHDQHVLLIIPDNTRTAPIGLVFRALHQQIAAAARSFDVLIALGTHQPLGEAAIRQRLEISASERSSTFGNVRFFNHDWQNPDALQRIGSIPAAAIHELSGGLFAMDVPVEINRRVFDYDRILIVGPVFPHEVVGFSGGNKYLFPGISGPGLLNFFHWLGAVITTPRIIGNKWTPVRKVIDLAAGMVKLEKKCIALVVHPDQSLAGIFIGSPETSWDQASELSRELHIVYKPQPFQTILACVPPMYEEIWTAGKAMYKLEAVLADGGELIIYGPHIREVCVTHQDTILAIGYHCRDYFLKQWDRFKHHPWGVLAHSSHVYGQGTYVHGVETPRVRVTLATSIAPEICRRINLGYRDPRSIEPAQFADRENDGVLMVPRAGEILHRLTSPPDWAK
jgi:nickel-dependent lactate racemase